MLKDKNPTRSDFHLFSFLFACFHFSAHLARRKVAGSNPDKPQQSRDFASDHWRCASKELVALASVARCSVPDSHGYVGCYHAFYPSPQAGKPGILA
jgi:hypothetical protein